MGFIGNMKSRRASRRNSGPSQAQTVSHATAHHLSCTWAVSMVEPCGANCGMSFGMHLRMHGSSGKKAHIITDYSMHGIVSRSGPGWSQCLLTMAGCGMSMSHVKCHVMSVSLAGLLDDGGLASAVLTQCHGWRCFWYVLIYILIESEHKTFQTSCGRPSNHLSLHCPMPGARLFDSALRPMSSKRME
jgi:hypothetical protein